MESVFRVVKCRNNYQWKDSRQRQIRILRVLTVCVSIISLVQSEYVNETFTQNDDCYDEIEPQKVYFEFTSNIIDNGIYAYSFQTSFIA